MKIIVLRGSSGGSEIFVLQLIYESQEALSCFGTAMLKRHGLARCPAVAQLLNTINQVHELVGAVGALSHQARPPGLHSPTLELSCCASR